MITVFHNKVIAVTQIRNRACIMYGLNQQFLADHLPPSIMTGINIAAVFARDGCDGCWSRYLLSL